MSYNFKPFEEKNKDNEIRHLKEKNRIQQQKLNDLKLTQIVLMTVCSVLVIILAAVGFHRVNEKVEELTTASATPETVILTTTDGYINRFSDIKLTNSEKKLIAKTIYLEARGESEEGQRAVCEVIFNRIKCKYFPDNAKDVIYEEGQFTTAGLIKTAPVKEEQLKIIDDVFNSEPLTDEKVVFFGTHAHTSDVAFIIEHHVFCRYTCEG
ncbi:MAG: cell wall hydrolase [Acutalibacteraceae bacterium]